MLETGYTLCLLLIPSPLYASTRRAKRINSPSDEMAISTSNTETEHPKPDKFYSAPQVSMVCNEKNSPVDPYIRKRLSNATNTKRNVNLVSFSAEKRALITARVWQMASSRLEQLKPISTVLSRCVILSYPSQYTLLKQLRCRPKLNLFRQKSQHCLSKVYAATTS